jgi:hypothetical protein
MVTTIAGSNSSVAADGVGTSAGFQNPVDIAVDPLEQFLLIADQGANAIRMLNLSTMVVTTIAGALGTAGFVQAIGTNARFNGPAGLAMDANADGSINAVYISEKTGVKIRKLDWSTRMCTSIGGSGVAAVPGVAGTNGNAALTNGGGALNNTSIYGAPQGLALSADKQFLYVSDTKAGGVRRINTVTLNDAWFAGLGGLVQKTTYNGAAYGNFIGGPIYPAFNPVGALVSPESWGNQLVIYSPAGTAMRVATTVCSAATCDGVGSECPRPIPNPTHAAPMYASNAP